MKCDDVFAIDLTGDELEFLYWCMKFIDGGPFGEKEEIQRQTFEIKINKIFKNFEEGFFHKNDNGEIYIKCAFCDGNGLFPDIFSSNEVETMPCPICKGKGFNNIKTKQRNLIKCKFCDGDGKAWDSNGYHTGEICQVCHGIGIVNLDGGDNGSEDEQIWSTLHPEIIKVSKNRFKNKHYSDSVEAAYKEINNKVKEIVKTKTSEEIDGAKLMYKAFSPSNPIIRLADVSTETGKNSQNGFAAGAQGAENTDIPGFLHGNHN